MDGSEGFTREVFLQRSGAAGAALLGGSVWATAAARARRDGQRRDPPIRRSVPISVPIARQRAR